MNPLVDLHDVVLSSVGMVHGRAEEAGVKLEFDVPADAPRSCVRTTAN